MKDLKQRVREKIAARSPHRRKIGYCPPDEVEVRILHLAELLLDLEADLQKGAPV